VAGAAFFPFPSWQKLVSAVCFIAVLSHAIGPVILLQLRNILPHLYVATEEGYSSP
jgi:hypothetical protein